MTGSRVRLGILIPSVNICTEPEFYKMTPEAVSIHFGRLEFAAAEPEYYEKMVRGIREEVLKLSHAHVNAIAFGCTTGSLYGGLGYDQRIIKEINKYCNVPATTTSTAVIEALKALNVKRLSILTPYEEWLNAKEKKFIEDHGFEVLKIVGMGLKGFDVGEVHPETVHKLAKQCDKREADAMFISCMGLHTIDILNQLEEDLKKPVISSNQTTMWMLLRMLGRRTSKIFGRLMELL